MCASFCGGIHAFHDFAAGSYIDSWPLFHSLTRNRPLVHGNERLAWSATRVFCLLNDTDLSCPDDEAEGMAMAAAAGDIDVTEITAWVRARCST